MSPTSSSPTDSRTTSGPAPARTRCSSESCRCVVEAGWMMRTPRVADIGEMAEKLDVAHEPHAILIAALEPEGEHGAGTKRAIALGEGVIGVAWQPRIVHPPHLGMTRQPLRHGQRVVAVALHAERQGLDAGQDQKGVEGRDGGPEIAQGEGATRNGETKIAEGLGEGDAVIAGGGLRQCWVAAALQPIEGAAIDDRAPDRVAVAP